MLFCSIFQRGYSGTPISLYRSADAPLRLIEVYWGLLRKSYCFYKTCYRGRLSHSNIGSLLFPTRSLTLAYQERASSPHSGFSGWSNPGSVWERRYDSFKDRMSDKITSKDHWTESAAQSHEKKVHTSTQQLIGKSIHSLHRHPLIDPQIESDQYLLYPRYTSIQRSCTNPDPFIPGATFRRRTKPRQPARSRLSEAHRVAAALSAWRDDMADKRLESGSGDERNHPWWIRSEVNGHRKPHRTASGLQEVKGKNDALNLFPRVLFWWPSRVRFAVQARPWLKIFRWRTEAATP